MISNTIEFIQANTELICLLKHFPIDYLEKLPNSLLESINKNSNEKYNIEIDVEKDLKNQNLSKETKKLLGVLTYKYWSNEQEKAEILKQININEDKYQKELRERYNPDTIFINKAKTNNNINTNINNNINTNINNNTNTINNNTNNTQTALIIHKESIWETIKNWFKNIFKK